ncbi:hypothetical protein GCM10010172_07270 [Paractinoplanes ferrugineus]|uniref:Uncharacterized protein n=1 Tax=Paractinoplanes ferrugineus TaxID=113564 RepID=A0A919JCH4_9ACTN|nr:hypothetical protein [Actinoplanes ferrugineus]GIE16794.1 hypothetical protein Afe05nite_86340 [Actinoplanes ferrugineus]
MFDDSKLTDGQKQLLAQVRTEWSRDGGRASDLLVLSGASRKDQAAVADVLAPGAGEAYLR